MVKTIIQWNKWADVVFIDTYSYQAFYFALISGVLSRLLGVRYICILRGGDLLKRYKHSTLLLSFLLRHAFKVVSPSRYLKENFMELGFKVVFIPNSININDYQFNFNHYETPKILWVRSFHKIYNPLLAARAIRLLVENHIAASLTMVGPDKDGSMSDFENYLIENNLEDRVKIAGLLDKSEWRKLAKEHSIFLNTTNADNMPVSVIEAMALGLPIISTNVGGMPYLIDDNKDGILIEPNDVLGIEKSVERLLESPEFGSKLAIRAREKVEAFDGKKVVKMWEEILTD